jgi:hypothetical protein
VIVVDQNVRRLDVLVKDSDRVRRRDGLGDLRDDCQPLGKRDLIDASALSRPLGQVPAFGIFAFEKKRWLVELHLVELGDVVAVPERVAQQAEERQFALEAT